MYTLSNRYNAKENSILYILILYNHKTQTDHHNPQPKQTIKKFLSQEIN